MLIKMPPLNIHAWGGLGSQLFALSLAFELKACFPKRSQVIILHTGGVTKRFPEIISLFPEFNYFEVDDFRQDHGGSESKTIHLKRVIRKLTRSLALVTGLLAEENNGKKGKVAPWTLSVRGHYLYRKVDEKFLTILYERLSSVVDLGEKDTFGGTIVHYRLGDLIQLSDKSPIRPERILNALQSIGTHKMLTVLSDSPNLASELLNDNLHGLTFRALELSTQSTLLAATQGEIFLGSSSKISYWVILLRIHNDNSSINFIPSGDSILIERILGNVHGIKYY